MAFTPNRNGWGWAMILPAAVARTANKEWVYNLQGALGGPFCKHGPRQLFANREEVRILRLLLFKFELKAWISINFL